MKFQLVLGTLLFTTSKLALILTPQDVFVGALENHDLSIIRSLLTISPKEIDPSVSENHALELATEAGDIILLKLLLEHPKTIPDEDQSHFLVDLALDKDDRRVLFELCSNPKVCVDWAFDNRRVFTFTCHWMIRGLTKQLLKACSTNDLTLFNDFSSENLTDLQFDMLLRRSEVSDDVSLLLKNIRLKSFGIKLDNPMISDYLKFIETATRCKINLSIAELREMLRTRANLYYIESQCPFLKGDIGDLIAISGDYATSTEEDYWALANCVLFAMVIVNLLLFFFHLSS